MLSTRSLRATCRRRKALALLALAFGSTGGVAAAQLGYAFDLTGAQEVPPVATAATGRALVVLDPATGSVRVSGSFSGLTTPVSAAHVHAAPAGVNGPILLALTVSGTTTGSFSGSGTLTSAQVIEMMSGLHYVNVHSGMHPAGEIRGQVRGAANVFRFSLDGAQEVPPNLLTPGAGSATVALDLATGDVLVFGSFHSLVGGPVSAAHLHEGAPGVNGGILVPLALTGISSGTFSGTGTLDPVQVIDLLCGLHYVNVHSLMFSSGEIRGQVFNGPAATVYGSGVNPAGSMSVLGGTPAVNTTFDLGVDNPLGTQAAGSIALLFLSTGQDPSFAATGAGTPLPGFGMSGAGAPGELLIGLMPPNPIPPIFVGGPWAGPGMPVPFTIGVPDDKSLHGRTFYAQGLMFDPSAGAPIRFALTDAVRLEAGL
jgi:hypothetical protein